MIRKNPAYLSVGKCGSIKMRKGGESDPRNKSLMKMFNMINIGERSGSGVPLIFNTWEDQGWNEPVIEERFDPDRTILSLVFSPKQVKKNRRRKTGEENRRRKQMTILKKYCFIWKRTEKQKQKIFLPVLVSVHQEPGRFFPKWKRLRRLAQIQTGATV